MAGLAEKNQNDVCQCDRYTYPYIAIFFGIAFERNH
jgi:hypothetical protein